MLWAGSNPLLLPPRQSHSSVASAQRELRGARGSGPRWSDRTAAAPGLWQRQPPGRSRLRSRVHDAASSLAQLPSAPCVRLLRLFQSPSPTTHASVCGVCPNLVGGARAGRRQGMDHPLPLVDTPHEIRWLFSKAPLLPRMRQCVEYVRTSLVVQEQGGDKAWTTHSHWLIHHTKSAGSL